ncbi:MAG: hypothetical protein H0W18_09455 [Acidobacteria bacterium]|nr:hypothetical protein [Acidobacteriota bacterium]
MRDRIVAVALAVCLPFVSACFDVEQAMKLQKDMSGEAGFTMTVNMEPMVLFMLKMQREMTDQKGEPTAAEIEKAKKEFLASGKTKTTTNMAQKEQMEKSLPPGVKLLSSSVKEDGLKITARFNLAFDNVSKLAQIQMSGKTGAAAAGPGPANPFDRPFPGLLVKDEGSTLLMTMEATNPAAEQKAQSSQMNMSGADLKMVEDSFKGLRFAFRIDTPLEVVDHNATRKEGQALLWEYDLKTMNAMTPEQLAQGIRVRFKK